MKPQPLILAPPEKIRRLAELRERKRQLEARDRREWATPGELAKAIDPATVQTPALDRIDEALIWAHDTPGARLVISLPPQEGKSQRVTRVGSLWALTRNPELRLGVVSYAQSLAEGFSRDIRNWIASFNGDEDTLDLGLRIAPDYGSARRWQLDGHRGGIVAAGIGSGLTGRALDCVAGDSNIITPEGVVTVAELVKAPKLPMVLSWNHDAERAEWRQVEATRTIPGREIVEVRTAAGRIIRCTPDHRVYTTGRGYVPASELRAGDSLVAAAAGPDPLQRLRHSVHATPVGPAEQQAGRAAVLHEGMPEHGGSGNADLRRLRHAVRAAPVRGGQGGQERLRALVLLQGMLRESRKRAARREEAMRDMRQAEAATGGAPGRAVLLRRVPPALLHGIRGLRPLRRVLRDAAVRAGEEAQARHEGVLLQAVHPRGHRGDAHQGHMPGMRRENAAALERPQVLHGRVPRQAPGGGTEAPGSRLHGVRVSVPATGHPDGVLLSGVRGLCPLAADDRGRQLALPDGNQLRGLVPEDAPADHRAGRRSVRGLPEVPAADEVHAQRTPRRAQFAARASHQRDPGGQPAREPDHALQDLSCNPPQVEYDTVSVVRRVRGEGHTVYDLQVEGNRNFFAGQVLVHNCLVIDDPFADAEQAGSAYYRDRVWDWWQSVGSTRLAPGAPAIVILTRWHENDLAGRLVAAEDGHRWRVINIPALADHDPAKGQSDPLGRQPGEWLESARGRTDAEWEQIRIQAGSRVFAALYQGRPSPDQGNVWQRQWWRRYREPLWSQHPDIPGAYVADCDEMLLSFDMSFKATSGSDYVAGQVWCRRGASAYLLDQVHKRLGFTDTLTAFAALAARWPQASRKLVESAANGEAVIDSFRGKIPGIVPVKPKESKYARASAVSPFIEAGNAFLPEPGVALFDVETFIDEAAGFPNAAHDDQVDSASQALAEMFLDGTGAQAWIEWARRKALEAAAARGEGPAPEPLPAAAARPVSEPVPDAVPLDPVAARKAARDAAYRAQHRLLASTGATFPSQHPGRLLHVPASGSQPPLQFSSPQFP